MSLIGIYAKYKNIYKDSIILIQSGYFWICFYSDAVICKYILGYTYKNNRVSFPNRVINHVLSLIQGLNISYILIYKDNIKVYENKNNSYTFYLDKYKNKFMYEERINKINNKLNIDNIEYIERVIDRV